MWRVIVTDVLGLSAIASWVVLSIFAILRGDSELFQRLGTLGIASGILYFALIRHSPAVSEIVQDRFISMRRFLYLNAQHIEVANRNTSFIAFELKRMRDELELEPREHLEEFVSGTLPHALATAPMQAKDMEARIAPLDETERAANDKVESQRRYSQMFEVWVVVLATLQTGFGDYLVSVVERTH